MASDFPSLQHRAAGNFGSSSRAEDVTLRAQRPGLFGALDTDAMPQSLTPDQLDDILALQLSVAWAGEAAGDPRRLGWWQTDLIDPEGGGDLFARLVPRTAAWAGFELAREAARRVEAAALTRIAKRDGLWTLFHFGFAVDEQLHDRLAYHRRHRDVPADVFKDRLHATGAWDAAAFAKHLERGGAPKVEVTPSGRLVKAKPTSAADAAPLLAAALLPLDKAYPLPHLEAPGE